MKKLRGLVELAGCLIFVTGLIICMCEVPELDKQLMMSSSGLATMASGAFLVVKFKGSEADYGYDY